MIYFKFNNTAKGLSRSNHRRISWQFMHRFFEWILPKANPDFDGLFDKVKTWYIEYDEITQFAIREVGVDDDNNVIVKAPWKNNLGFWLDESLKYEDYILFNITQVTSVEFESLWKEELI